MALQKELSQIMGLISKIHLWIFGPKIIEWPLTIHSKAIEWIYHISYRAPVFGKIERYNGLLKAMLKAMGGRTFKH